MARLSTPQEIFDAMPGYFKPEMAPNTNAVVQFDLSGEGGGQWHAALADGNLTVNTGAAASPNVTIFADAQDFVSLANGDMNPVQAFMRGKIKTKGDMALLMRLQKLFSRG